MPQEKTQPSSPGSRTFNWTGKGLSNTSRIHIFRNEIFGNGPVLYKLPTANLLPIQQYLVYAFLTPFWSLCIEYPSLSLFKNE
jgi:hypothetical protein